MARPKPPIPRGFLNRKGLRTRGVRAYAIAVMLLNAAKAVRDPEIGWGDVLNGYLALKRRLNFRWMLTEDIIESMLWCSNMLDEKGEFMHPEGIGFQEFVDKTFPHLTFDRTFGKLSIKNQEKKNGTNTP